MQPQSSRVLMSEITVLLNENALTEVCRNVVLLGRRSISAGSSVPAHVKSGARNYKSRFRSAPGAIHE